MSSIAVHATDKPLAEDVDLDGVARKTYGFSGAQLADLLNEAAIIAARREAERIAPEDLHAGWLKVAVGTSRRRSMDERERSIIMHRYGLEQGSEPLTLEQVGTKFGVTKERIRQIESRALHKMQKIAHEEKLDIPGV